MARKLAEIADRERQLSDGEWKADQEGETKQSPQLDRRSYVKLGGAVALSTLPTPASASGLGTVTRGGIEFDDVLDAVADLGMDPSGGVPVDGAVRAAGDGALIQFPDGTYRFERDSNGALFEGGRRGIEGIGDDVLLTSRTGRFSLGGTALDGAYLDNVIVGRTGQPGYPEIRLAGDRVVLTNISFRGGCAGTTSNSPTLVVSTPASRGGARLRNLSRARDGDDPATATPGTDTLRIAGTGTPANYEFTVDGRIEVDEMPSAGHNLSGANSEGTVEREPVSYLVDGEITDFRLDGAAAVDLNGDSLEPAELGSRSPNVLVFDGRGAATTYTFDVGGLRSGPALGAGTAPNRVSDSVSEGVAEYRFDGDVSSLTVRGTTMLTMGSR